MELSEITKRLGAFDLETVRATLSEAPEPTDGRSLDAIIEHALGWVDSLRRDMITLVEQIGGGEDVEMALAIQYVELKSRWIAFNTKMNYAMFRHGAPDVADMCRAAAISAFLAYVEPMLNPSDIDHITDFLAQPLSDAA